MGITKRNTLKPTSLSAGAVLEESLLNLLFHLQTKRMSDVTRKLSQNLPIVLTPTTSKTWKFGALVVRNVARICFKRIFLRHSPNTNGYVVRENLVINQEWKL